MNYRQVCERLAEKVCEAGGKIVFQARVTAVRHCADGVVVVTTVDQPDRDGSGVAVCGARGGQDGRLRRRHRNSGIVIGQMNRGMYG